MNQIYYPKLRELILQQYDSFSEFARVLGVSRQRVCSYFENNISFSLSQMDRWAECLGVKRQDYWQYFYREKQK